MYRDYRIRKTATLLKECIARKIPFHREYVELSVEFQKHIESMSLPDIEVLHMKCQQTLGGKCLPQILNIAKERRKQNFFSAK